MPIKFINLILFLTLLLAGCTPAAVPEISTAAPSRIASQPSKPTLTPTVTMTITPLPQNACPVTDEAYQYPFPKEVSSANELIDPVLEALNNGITLAHLHESLKEVGSAGWDCTFEDVEDENGNITRIWEPCKRINNPISMRDLTGDGVKEVIFTASTGGMVMPYKLQIYTCRQGEYIKLFNHEYHYENDIDFFDLNGNRIPEIIIHTYDDVMIGPHLLYIYEWDGESFRSLIPPHEIYQDSFHPDAFVTYKPSTVDEFQWNSDGIYKVIIRGLAWRFGTNDATFGPYRDYYLTLSWDGTHFQAGFKEPAPAKYRFQAVEDGDWETWRGNYEQAMAYYNQALKDPALESWGDQECQDQWEKAYYSLEEGKPTPTPCPPDPNEQAVLKAYLHYRYMLIYTAQGKENLAQNEYLALNQLYSSHPAYPLKGLASAFWDEYQTSKDLVTACDNVQDYYSDNLWDFHNSIDNSWCVWKSPTRELICPFEGDLDKLVDWD